MAAIKGLSGELWLMGGSATSMTKEACEAVGGSSTVFHVTAPTKRYLDPATTVSVYDNDVLQTSGYIIAGGQQVQFTSAPTTPITISGKYLPTGTEIGLVQNWAVTIDNGTLIETTSLGSTSRSYIHTGFVGWSGSFDRFLEDDAWEGRLAAESTLLIKLYEDQPNTRLWSGYVILSGWNENVSIDDLVRENVTFQGLDMPVYAADET